MYESQAMQQAISRVFANQLITEFTLTIRLTSGADASYSYSPLMVDDLVITQNFADQFMDYIKLSFKSTDQDYVNIFQHASQLLAVLTFTFIDSTKGGGQNVYTPAPIVKKYTAILLNPENKQATKPQINNKTYPMVQQTGSPNTQVELQLIETTMYHARQRQFNGIFTGTTNSPPNNIKSLLIYIAKAYECKTMYLVAPDNVNPYQHIIIPPGAGIGQETDIFDYVQDTYGSYMKGLEYYYTNDILYIYPPYENNPAIPFTLNILNSFNGMYSGHKSYHMIEGQTTTIVSNQKTDTVDLTHMASENHGTSKTFLRSSRVIDNYTTTTSQGTKINTNGSLLINADNMAPVIPGTNNAKYQKATDNIFQVASELAKYQAVLISLGWTQAIPYSLYPGQKIKYFYDANNVFNKASGILEAVDYTISKVNKLPIGMVYKCNAKMRIRVDPKAPNITGTA